MVVAYQHLHCLRCCRSGSGVARVGSGAIECTVNYWGARMADYDVVVIGSGFGGSVTALRLTEKGYRVGVLEAGRRFTDETLPKTSWGIRNFLWAPKLGCTGIQRIHLLKDCVILAGAGVGGGSLNYANTLYEPLQPFYDDPQWAHITDWRDELAPHYAQAKQMLGVVTNPTTTPSDVEMQRLAEQFGKGDTFHATPVGVFFGRDGEQEPGETVPDPFFGGAGPERTGCIQCGECMTGCRHGAKNTLVTNYLYLAEKHGAQIHPLTTVTDVRPLPERRLRGRHRAHRAVVRRRRTRTFTADQVVFAAGTYNTQKLLHRLRDDAACRTSRARLGYLTRTNSEALLGVRIGQARSTTTPRASPSPRRGTRTRTPTSSRCRYGKGSNAMGLLNTILTDGGTRRHRWAQFAARRCCATRQLLRLLVPRKWSERVIILLVMQTLNNSITVHAPQDAGSASRADLRPGRRRAEPDLDPGGEPGRRAARRERRRRSPAAPGAT